MIRDYQAKMIASCHYWWSRRYRRILVCMATGLGKTHSAVELMRAVDAKHGTRSIFLVDRIEIVNDTIRRVKQAYGDVVTFADEDPFRPTSAPVVCTVQGFMCRLAKFATIRDQFGTMIIDEAHRAVDQHYREVIHVMNPARLLGLTATPIRHDHIGLWNVFEWLPNGSGAAFVMDIATGTKQGWLVPVKVVPVHPRQAIDEYLRLVGDGQGVLFVKSCNQSIGLMAGLSQAGHVARHVDSTQRKDRRRETIDRFNEGRYQTLVNVGVLREGFDAPAIRVVGSFGYHRSSLINTQQMGRLTRPLVDLSLCGSAWARRWAIHRSAKPVAYLLEFADRYYLKQAKILRPLAGYKLRRQK